MSLFQSIEQIKEQFSKEISGEFDFEQLKVKYLGRKGLVAGLFQQMGGLTSDERPKAGKLLNELKLELTSEIEKLAVDSSVTDESTADSFDYTMPGDPQPVGAIHPLTQVLEEIKSIFNRLGFSVAYGPEVDTDFYNFEALNIPKHHPARDMQDTFYVKKDVVLRTHTSNSQIHNMLKHDPPVKIIAPGRVYRNEDISVRSYCLFHQIEGLYVDKNVTMGDLKGVLDYFAKELYGKDVKTRFRPSYFPFTEPSAEMDVSCIFCKGKGCNICKYAGWLEILGCGMVDPEVFKSVGYDPEKWTGYAFGLGIERIAMLKYGVEDIRLFYEGDIRFLRQF
ncbi:MAG: phenylalanine--tRNA ligase subunit alpha [Candidatus Marinimicrobia bacterium]|nr:phenylalanine--tRNA ligase subunit alpha [Candidatus Neomarinimicrobiota bacterium]MBL7022769.1 phenylalanine--tRNA ligase subunit alpha [Candidatus Neomarinimicrobiota bacterium]MBL7109710.1 phenylalanine--tRNA ligase subunit alpha [Candidatus Neomarinimicrobiota bacterium]